MKNFHLKIIITITLVLFIVPMAANAMSWGNLDGDEYEDLLIADSKNNEAGVNTGKVYVILGKDIKNNEAIDLSNAYLILFGAEPGEQIGMDAYFIADEDGDGLDEIVIGNAMHEEDAIVTSTVIKEITLDPGCCGTIARLEGYMPIPIPYPTQTPEPGPEPSNTCNVALDHPGPGGNVALDPKPIFNVTLDHPGPGGMTANQISTTPINLQNPVSTHEDTET